MDLKEDGSFRMNMAYFDYCAGLKMTSRKLDELFGGPPRKPESPLTQREMDLARSVQSVTEEAVLRMARHVHGTTGLKHLCLAGGVALNCVANGRLLREGPYEDIWIQPAAGDAGGALGAALLGWHRYHGRPREVDGRSDRQRASYLGPGYGAEAVERFLSENELPAQRLSLDEIPERIAQLIEEQNVIGWFHGRMEYGPRALGSRSILGDPRSPKMQSVMNLKIKFRESFRPFAPSVLVDHAADFFAIDRPSPYMLLVAPVERARHIAMTPEQEQLFGIDKLNVARSDIPAITHVDYTARIQSVARADNQLYYDMIDAFRRRTGIALVINTSFNVRGEPIVCSPEDAYKCFMRTEMDYLLLSPFLLDKRVQPERHARLRWDESFELD
jgi:carbamoyltransferase